jgi:hypothetical protein
MPVLLLASVALLLLIVQATGHKLNAREAREVAGLLRDALAAERMALLADIACLQAVLEQDSDLQVRLFDP